MAAESADAALAAVTYEELAHIEDEFDEVDMEIMRQQYTLSTPLYTKRATTVSNIPNFWALVLEQAPMEIDQFIQPSDSQIFAESLTGLQVTRPELDSGSPNASPKSLKIRFEFKPNDFFEETVLEKDFTFRRAKDGWSGLVSEPVKITWKKGKDLSEGLTDGAYTLFEARKKAGDFTKADIPEYTSLKKKVEHLNGAGTSFFTWFGWVSGRRYVSAEESEEAMAEHRAKRAARKAGAKVDGATADEEDDADKDAENDDQDVEVHEMGEDLAVSFAEDLWPNAIKYFLEAQEADDLSEADFEDDDEEMDDDDGEEVDIRALVNGKGKKRVSDIAPPAKKRKS